MLPPNRPDLTGPFDIIGDVHGCLAELRALLAQLGYAGRGTALAPQPGRTAVFVGDLVDRGPAIPGVLALVMDLAAAGRALCVIGNHDAKLVRHLKGKNVRLTNGLAESVAQLAQTPPAFRQQVLEFLESRPSHYVLDGGRLVVAHGGLPEAMHGRDDGRVRAFALYGATTGKTDALGLPVRLNWAADYHGAALVVYGHTPVPRPLWVNSTINIDTGCVFGGRLTALRYPEGELVSVPAARPYAETRPSSPLLKDAPCKLPRSSLPSPWPPGAGGAPFGGARRCRQLTCSTRCWPGQHRHRQPTSTAAARGAPRPLAGARPRNACSSWWARATTRRQPGEPQSHHRRPAQSLRLG
jgi:diadenosine tetraphosphatase ApaH/serine/threonine PP2A family protein phosphatase